MTFGMTLGEHLKMAASASMLHIAIDYKIKTNVKVAASNKTIKITQLFSKQWKNSGDLTGTCSWITYRLYVWK